MADAVWLIVGVAVGAGLALLVIVLRSGREKTLTQSLLAEVQAQKVAELNAIVEQLRTAFGALSRDALSQNTDDFLKLATTKLDERVSASSEQIESKKKLIDAALTSMNTKLAELAGQHSKTTGALESAVKATGQLRETTDRLREALSSSQRRGQWGERMAEDILRLIGFIEGVNYRKQAAVESGERPDFTFLMPRGLTLNMDVKFPLDNYLRALEAGDDEGRKQREAAFLRDVRAQVKTVTGRSYISPEDGTVDCVLVFIPNEQIYHFIHERDPSLLDDAARQKVVLCSPLTLYAVLTVVRQAVDNFRLEQTSNEILGLLGAFRKEWAKFGEVVDKMERGLETAVKAFDELKTTRTRKLERQLDRVEDLQRAKGVPAADEESGRAMIDVHGG